MPKTLRDENRNVFKNYQAEHPEFTLYFKYKKFVVPAPNSNNVTRSTDLAKVHTVAYSSRVDLLSIACNYLAERLGCTSLSRHDTIAFVPRSLLVRFGLWNGFKIGSWYSTETSGRT